MRCNCSTLIERTALRRYLVGVAAVAAALVLPTAAAAKVPSSASITGPGLDPQLAIAGDGELGSGTPLGALVDLGGFMAQMYGQSPSATVKARPMPSVLGPRYRIAYVVPGPNAVRSRVVQLMYPFAKPVPLTYMKVRTDVLGHAQDGRRLVPQLARTRAHARESRTARRALSGQPMSG